jgi:hypothetical protein
MMILLCVSHRTLESYHIAADEDRGRPACPMHPTAYRDCLKSPDSPETKVVEAYETDQKGLFCCGMPTILAHETPLSDFLDSFYKTNSPKLNFGFTEFSEVRKTGFRYSLPSGSHEALRERV